MGEENLQLWNKAQGSEHEDGEDELIVWIEYYTKILGVLSRPPDCEPRPGLKELAHYETRPFYCV